MVRAGEYMSWSEDPRLAAYGHKIQQVAVANLEQRSVPLGKALRNITGEDRRKLFSAVEAGNYSVIAAMVPAESWKSVLDLVSLGCSQWVPEFECHLPVPLPGEGI